MKALEILKQVKELPGWIKCGEELPFDEELDEAIAELEEAMKPKSCGLCVFFTFDEELNDGFGQCFYSIHFPNIYSSYHEGDCHYCSEFKPKDNA